MSWEAMRRFSLRETEEPEGGEEVEETPSPVGGGGKTLPITVIPEEFRDKSEVEIRFLLERMADAAASGGTQIRELRQQLSELQEKVSRPPEPAEPDPDEDLSDEELIQKDATKAINRILAREGLAGRFAGVEESVGEATLNIVGAKIPDFEEYRKDIEEILKISGVPKTRENIEGAYTMAVGRRTLAEKFNQKKKAAGMDKARADVPSDSKGKFRELSGLEKDIFDASGMSREEWEKYSSDDAIDVEVPLK